MDLDRIKVVKEKDEQRRNGGIILESNKISDYYKSEFGFTWLERKLREKTYTDFLNRIHRNEWKMILKDDENIIKQASMPPSKRPRYSIDQERQFERENEQVATLFFASNIVAKRLEELRFNQIEFQKLKKQKQEISYERLNDANLSKFEKSYFNKRNLQQIIEYVEPPNTDSDFYGVVFDEYINRMRTELPWLIEDEIQYLDTKLGRGMTVRNKNLVYAFEERSNSFEQYQAVSRDEMISTIAYLDKMKHDLPDVTNI